MIVNRIGRFTTSNQFAFKRRLTAEEERDYKTNALRPALDYLGTEETAIILHGTSFPETDREIGVGSPYGKEAAKIIPFLTLHGFNATQLGPVGAINDIKDVSPYGSAIFTKNYLFIDFDKLTTDKYACILSNKDIQSVFNMPEDEGRNYAYSNFADAFANYKYAIKITNQNFKTKLRNNDPRAIELNKEYCEFLNKNGSDVKKEALFNILSDYYGTNDFSSWSYIDNNLINLLKENNPDAIERYKKIIIRSKEDYEAYLFGQFIINKQIKENTELRKKLNYKYISDLPVGYAPSDQWANRDLFLEDWRLGCPYGGEYGPQLWEIPVLAPQKLFNPDGSLGKAGIYLKKKIEACLKNFDNIRIDHVLGLIDPYIYKKDSVEIVDGKINQEKFIANNISKLDGIDPDGNYEKILNKILLPTLKEYGIDKDYPIWEDLGAETEIFNRIYRQKNNLPGITQLEWMRGENYQNSNNWGLVGSHDSDPAVKMIQKEWVKNSDAWNIFYLAGFLNSNPSREKERNMYCEKIASDDLERVKAKFAELFLTCKKIQISFADFFGIDKTYNSGGKKLKQNWKLRLNKDYQDSYYKNLSSAKPTAINMPEILKIAVQAKSDMENVKLAKELMMYKGNTTLTNTRQVQQIIDNLDKYEKILKEKE